MAEFTSNQIKKLDQIKSMFEPFIEDYQDETYEVNSKNTITGITIEVDNIKVEYGTYYIYIENTDNGDYCNVRFNTYEELLKAQEYTKIALYDTSLSQLGKFFVGGYTKVITNEHYNEVQEFLQFLENKGIITIHAYNSLNFDKLEEALKEWKKLEKTGV